MLFNTLAFAKFFAIVFVASWLVARFKQARLGLLLVASYYFYAHWDFRFLPLLFASSTMDFLLALAIDKADDQRRRKRLLVVTVIVNLGLLSFFKYWGFALDTARTVLTLAGTPEAGASLSSLALRVALPVGISFYTFESMSYVIDVYRRDMPACRSYPRYLLFVAFFPHLVAGPIVRPKDLLPQLENPPPLLPSVGGEGLFLVASGLLKKVVLGDYLAVNLVDRVFDRPEAYSSLEMLVGVYGYAAQIYCDFSGYTDIAIGCALLLGVRLNKNFASPYQSTDLQEFWRRWHISLSTWLRDYLYIPLGGNRGSELATYRNLMITMLLGGLWHGASWTFVFWGFLHGAALAVTRFVQHGKPARSSASPAGKLWFALCGLLTFHYVCFAWVFFRAPTFERALAVLRSIGKGTTFTPNLPPSVLVVLGLAAVTHLVPEGSFDRLRERFAALPPAAQAALLFAVAVVLHELAGTASVPFVYFQFLRLGYSAALALGSAKEAHSMRSFTQTWLGAALIGSTLFLGGCKREVPSNIVDSTMRKVFLTNLPYTSTAMCGQKVTGVTLSTVTVTAKGENLTGTAHVKGTATGPKGPLTCEGDVDFTYTTTTSSKKKGIGKKKKTTTTTTYWLSTVKLKAVQTPGVTFVPPPDEKPPEDDGDDLERSGSPRRRFGVLMAGRPFRSRKRAASTNHPRSTCAPSAFGGSGLASDLWVARFFLWLGRVRGMNLGRERSQGAPPKRLGAGAPMQGVGPRSGSARRGEGQSPSKTDERSGDLSPGLER